MCQGLSHRQGPKQTKKSVLIGLILQGRETVNTVNKKRLVCWKEIGAQRNIKRRRIGGGGPFK